MLLSWHLYSLSESSSCSSSSLIFLIDLNSREEAGRVRHEEAWKEEMPLLYPWKRMSGSVVHFVLETNLGEQEKTSLRETERKRHSKFRSDAVFDAVFVRLRRRDCEGPKRSWRCLSLFHPMLELFKSLCTLYSLHYTSLLTIDSFSSTEFHWFHSFMFICLVHFLSRSHFSSSLYSSVNSLHLSSQVSLYFSCVRDGRQLRRQCLQGQPLIHHCLQWVWHQKRAYASAHTVLRVDVDTSNCFISKDILFLVLVLTIKLTSRSSLTVITL